MKRSLFLLFPLLPLFIAGMACQTGEGVVPAPAGPATSQDNGNDTRNNRPPGSRMRIKTGSRTFTATLLNNATVTAFKARLPLTLSMKELNGNEKFAQLSTSLPTNALNPGTIQAGDLMLYGSNTLVLFYESFRTSYPYTKLGRIDNPSGLAAALGPESVTVTFERE